MSYIKDRKDFIERQASEKNVLVHVQANKRLINWNNVSGGLYSRTVPYYVVSLYNCVEELTQASDMGSIVPGSWYFNPKTGELFVNLLDNSDPGLTDLVATHRFFFSDVTGTASYNLTDEGTHVLYEGRILGAPGYNHKIGYEQNLTSVVGQGNLKLANNDGELDEIFDQYYFENQQVFVYSWNNQLDFSEARLIYRGRVTNKKFDQNEIQFTVKDTMYDLNQPVPTGVYGPEDNVDTNLIGKSKRWVYGRVDGMLVESLDKVGDGFLIPGTGTIAAGTKTLFGTGTSFLTDVTIEDSLELNGRSYTVENIYNDETIELTSEATFGVTNVDILLKPETAPTSKNRRYLVTSHACSEITTTIVNILQLNRVTVDDNSNFESGDLIQIGSSGEKVEIKTVAPNNILVFFQALVTPPSIGDTVSRIPIQDVFNNGVRLLEEDFTINNTSSGCEITIDSDAEINVAPILSSNVEVKFINSSRTVMIVGDKDNAKDLIKPNDLIRSSTLASTIFYGVIGIEQIKDSEIDFVDYLDANFPIIVFNFLANFPATGEVGRVYKAFSTGTLYSWDGANYIPIVDIYSAPATNYNTTTRAYLKDVDRFKYDVGMNVEVTTGSGQFFAEITSLSRTEGNVYVEFSSANSVAFQKGDKINSIDVLKLRSEYQEPTNNGNIEYKKPDFLNDDSSVSVNLLGKTKDGTPTGDWIKTGPEAVLDICQSLNIPNINVAKFDEAKVDAPQLISLTIPQNSGSQQQKASTAINLINKSVIGSLNMDNNLNLQYRIIQPNIDENNIPEIRDEDVIGWKVSTVNGKVIQSIGLNYRHMDYRNSTKNAGTLNIDYSYDFVNKYIKTIGRDDIDTYLYRDFDANIRAHRETYHRSLSRSDIEIVSDLRLENYEIGDSLVLNFQRLYRRLGDNYNKKIVMVVGKRVTGNRITLFTTDFGNLYNRSDIITRNDAPSYSIADSEEKLKLGFITDNQGIIDDDENTFNNQQIS